MPADERVEKATKAILNLSGIWPNPEYAEHLARHLARSILAVLDTLDRQTEEKSQAVQSKVKD